MPCRPYKFYSVYDRDTDMPLIIHGTVKECTERLGITEATFRSYVSQTRSGVRKNKYEVYVDDLEEEE